jgi:putative ABC transport system permease protein
MRLRRSVRLSLRALLAHKVRASLSIASITVGVAAVLLTSAVGVGARREVMLKVENMGTNLLVVRPAQVRKLAARKTISGSVTSLRLEDYQAISELDSVAAAAPGAEGTMSVKAGFYALKSKVLGTTPGFPAVRRFQVRSGRFFDAEDNRTAGRVAVLGSRVADVLFPYEDPTGRDIRIRGVPFEVIGVLQSKGVSADGSDEDTQVLVPIRTALRRVLNVRWLSAIYVSARNEKGMEQAQTQVRDVLRERHRPAPPPHDSDAANQPDDFAVQNTASFLAMQKRTADSLDLLTTGIAALALVVGGTGVLALMLLSVKERTAEIGLRIAVGARPRDILTQFLLEATLLCAGGWIAGMALGAAGAAVVAFSTQWALGVPVGALFASWVMAIATGLLFGAIPARKASLLPPMEALRAQ